MNTEEEVLVSEMNADKNRGTETVSVLFEEQKTKERYQKDYYSNKAKTNIDYNDYFKYDDMQNDDY